MVGVICGEEEREQVDSERAAGARDNKKNFLSLFTKVGTLQVPGSVAFICIKPWGPFLCAVTGPFPKPSLLRLGHQAEGCSR